jgi:tRNA threonylcarbamoyladenosine biosynthesis protein TsaB
VRNSRLIWFGSHAYNRATNRDVSNKVNFDPAVREFREQSVLTLIEHEELLTLAVDTATEKRSVAVFRGGQQISAYTNDVADGGSVNILGDMERALEYSHVRLEEIGLFAAAAGPGSFTGLRAGIATLKGLALTLGKPLVGVQTLHAVAHAARPAQSLAALIPAGRGEVFAQLLAVNVGGEVSEHEEASHVQPARLVERVARLGGGVKWAGGGAHKFIELIRACASSHGIRFKETFDENVLAAEDEWVVAPIRRSLAADVAALARLKFLRGEVESAESLRAIYVRPSDAELKGSCHAQS